MNPQTAADARAALNALIRDADFQVERLSRRCKRPRSRADPEQTRDEQRLADYRKRRIHLNAVEDYINDLEKFADLFTVAPAITKGNRHA